MEGVPDAMLAAALAPDDQREPTQEEVAAYLDSLPHDPLVSRASGAMLTILAAVVAYSAAKFWFEPATGLAWYGPVGALAVFELLALWWIRSPRSVRQIEILLVANAAVACAAATAAGIAAGRTNSVDFLLLGLCMLCAAMLPWHPKRQATVAVIAGVAIVINAYGVTGAVFATVGFPTMVPAAILLGASVYTTYSMQAARLHTARSDLMRERAEERTRELNATLERRVGERTAEIEQFTHIAAHDLREPARRVALLADMVLEEAEAAMPPEAVDLLKRMRREAERMLTVVSAFRALTGLSGGTLQRSPTNLEAEIASALTLFEDKLAARGVQVEVEPLGKPNVYRELILPLYRNLIGNALRHGPNGEFHLRFSSSTQNGETVYEVSNTGSDVPDSKLQAIFLPFVRLNAEDASGSGLGLSICRRIVERHSGRIWAECDDAGFRVRFTLGREV